MECNLSSSPPCIPFYPYTMFQNPMPKPSHQKSRYTIMMYKVLSYIVLTQCIAGGIPKNLYVQLSGLWNTFSLFKLMISGSWKITESSGKQISHFVDFDWEKASLKWLEWHIFKVWGVPNPTWHWFQVYTISGSWQITISGKNFTFCWFWLGKMHWNGLSIAHM